MKFLLNYLRLVRLPNLFTAISNVWAGSVIAANGSPDWRMMVFVSLSSAALYAGGVALNDYCDRETDRRERPNRPIPSGRVGPKAALTFAIALFSIGLLFGFIISPIVGLVSCAIIFCAVLYDIKLKKYLITAIITMGLCRGLNWTLGLKTVWAPLGWIWLIPLGILIYIASITVVSRYENVKPRLRLLVKYAILAIPIIDGAVVLWFGYTWQAGLIMALIVPAVLLGKLFEVT